jgi:hypothetical protein
VTDPTPGMVHCSNCGTPFGGWRDGKLKLRVATRLIAVRQDGGVEMTCEHCKRSTDLPLRHCDAEGIAYAV